MRATVTHRKLWVLLAVALVPLLLVAALVVSPDIRVQYELWQGDRRLASREYGAALRHYSSAAQASPSDAAPIVRVAQLYEQLGVRDKADAAWRDALSRSPEHPAALSGMGRDAAGRRAYDEAADLFRRALARAPESQEARAGLAEVIAQQGDLRAAAAEWQRLLALPRLAEPWKARAHLGLGLSLLANEPAAAVGELAKAASADGSRNDLALETARQLLGLAVAENGQPDATRQAHRQALLGYVYLHADLLVPARDALERAVSLRPDYPDALAYLGAVYSRRGEDTRALPTLERAVVLAPASAMAHYFYATAFRDAARFAEAVDHLRVAAELDPTNEELPLVLARTFVADADYDAAGAVYEGAIARSPGNEVLLREAASFHLDRLFRIDRGLTWAREAVVLSPQDARAQDLLGWALNLAGRPEEGLAPLRSAVSLAPTSARARYHFAVAAERSGLRDEASAAYRRVLELDIGRLAERAAQAISEMAVE